MDSPEEGNSAKKYIPVEQFQLGKDNLLGILWELYAIPNLHIHFILLTAIRIFHSKASLQINTTPNIVCQRKYNGRGERWGNYLIGLTSALLVSGSNSFISQNKKALYNLLAICTIEACWSDAHRSFTVGITEPGLTSTTNQRVISSLRMIAFSIVG